MFYSDAEMVLPILLPEMAFRQTYFQLRQSSGVPREYAQYGSKINSAAYRMAFRFAELQPQCNAQIPTCN